MLGGAVLSTVPVFSQTPAEGTDVTGKITNPSFENGFAGWTNAGLATQTNQYFPGKEGTTYAEKWTDRGKKVGDASVSQKLSGLSDGKYRLTAAAGNIQQKAGQSAENLGDPQTGVNLYAGSYATPVSDVNDYTVDFTIVGGEVEIGLDVHNCTGNWVTLDNFRLYYLGENTPAENLAFINHLADDFKAKYLSLHIQKKVADAASSALTKILSDLGSAPDASATIAAKNKIEALIPDVEASAALYDALGTSIEYARKMVSWYEDDSAKTGRLNTALGSAVTAWDNLELEADAITSAKNDLDTVIKAEDKKYHTPSYMGDVTKPDNAYYIGRTRQSKNWILFWEKGFGENPKTFACGNYTVNVDQVLERAEKAFAFYIDNLKFTKRGESKTDEYKMVIRLRYAETDWEATGSGVDNLIGLLTLTPWAATADEITTFHEVGHCFQYQVHCDDAGAQGFMYEPGGGTGCAFWEQCAQWMAFKLAPAKQFPNGNFSDYLGKCHKHILHESYRYASHFVHDYWAYRHGIDIISRIWHSCKSPEDAVSTYKRITGITDSEFNDEMYDCAARFATWDIPALKDYGKTYIASRQLPAMTNIDNYWRINPEVCPENTGYNVIRLVLPEAGTKMIADFEGLNNQDGYRAIRSKYAEWRYGFVAHLKDGTRVYSDMFSANYENPKSTGEFVCPENVSKLYFVVSAGTSKYWNQAWDDNDANDEQWPYQVRFGNTNRYGSKILAVEDTFAGDIHLPAVNIESGRIHVEDNGSGIRAGIYDLQGRKAGICNPGESITFASGIYIIRLVTTEGKAVSTSKLAI